MLSGNGIDDVYYAHYETPLHVGLVNGAFELGDMTGWTTFTNPGGTLGGVGFPDVINFDTNGDTVATKSLQLLVGNGGGGVHQNVILSAGTVNISVDIAAKSSSANSEGGLFELLLDGQVAASHNFGALSANATKRAVLAATVADVVAGQHELRVRVIRTDTSTYGSTPFQYIDNIQVFGNAESVIANDEGDQAYLSTILVTGPRHGTLKLLSDGSFSYTPEEGFVGEDTFVYKPVQAGEGLTLYTVDAINDKLVTLDSASAQYTIVGSIGHDMLNVDLAFNDGLLYALNVGEGTCELVVIDPTDASMISAIPLVGISSAKGITFVDNELYIMNGGYILANVNTTTGVVTGLVNYQSLSGGFNYNFSTIATDNEGRIISSWLDWESIASYHLGFDPPSIAFLGRSYPPDARVNDSTFAGENFFVLNDGKAYLHRINPTTPGYNKTLESISTGLLGNSFSGLAYASTLETKTAVATINVLPADSPTTVRDAYVMNEDGWLFTNANDGVLANDSDPEGNPLTAVIVTGPQHANRLMFNPDGTFLYNPQADYYGSDSFTYIGNNGTFDSNPTTVWITINPVNDAPVAVDDLYNVDEDGMLEVSVSEGVLADDYDVDGDSIQAFAIAGGPSHGTLQFNSDGSFTYTPYPDYNGTDSFSYRAHDGLVTSNIATLTITVNPLNDAPAASDDVYGVDEDAMLMSGIPGVLANDSDIDGDPLTAVLLIGPGHALSFSLKEDGSFFYVPQADYWGMDSFTYQAFDGQVYSQTAMIAIAIHPVNDAFPLAEDDYYWMNEGDELIVPPPGLLDNDTDADGDALSAVLAIGPQHAQTFVLSPDGSFIYHPEEGFHGTDSFTYFASDGWGNTQKVAAVEITINGSPVGIADAYEIGQEGTLIADADQGVLTNDSDPEGEPLIAILTAAPAHAAWFTFNENGSFAYTPRPGYYGVDGFGYQVSDGSAASSAIWVEIAVTPVQGPPVAADDSYTVFSSQTISASAVEGVLANDSEYAILATLLVAPHYGSLNFRSDGSFDYIPNSGYHGYDSFVYRAFDGAAFSDPAYVWFVGIEDANLESSIRNALAMPGGEITHADLAELTSLYADGMDIAVLDGIQHCQNLLELSLNGNQIDNLAPLADAGLSSLSSLRLADNKIINLSSLAGAGLAALTELDLQGNQIDNLTGLAAAGAESLSLLRLNNNQINDLLPLAGAAWTELAVLDLSNNLIDNLTAMYYAGLAGLSELNLSNNRIKDIGPITSSSGLANGVELDLNGNPLSWVAYSQQLPLLRTRLTAYYDAMPSQIQGLLWNDLDNNGKIGFGEPAVGGFTVYVDVNGNGVLDINEPVAIADEEGAFVIENVMPGELVFAVLPQNGWKVWSSNPDVVEVGNDCIVTGIELAMRKHFSGDADLNGTVDQCDGAILAAHWLLQSGATWGMGDFTGDGRVDDRDAVILAVNMGRTLPKAVASSATESLTLAIEPEIETESEEPELLPGDASGDGTVDNIDAAILTSNWQKQSGAVWADGDFTGDGRIDDDDAKLLAINWRKTLASAAADRIYCMSEIVKEAAELTVPAEFQMEGKSSALLVESALKSTSQAMTAATDVALTQEFGPQIGRANIQYQKLAWAHTYTQRQFHGQDNRILDKSALAVEMLLEDNS